MSRKQQISYITSINEVGAYNVRIGYHAEYREWNGRQVRGVFVEVTHKCGVDRIYADSYAELVDKCQEIEAMRVDYGQVDAQKAMYV